MRSSVLTGLLSLALACSARAQHVLTVNVDIKTTDNVKNPASSVQVQLLTGLNIVAASYPAVANPPAVPPAMGFYTWIPLPALTNTAHVTTYAELHNAKLNIILYPAGGPEKWTFDFDVRVQLDDNTTRIYSFNGAKLSPDSRAYSVYLP